MLETGRCQNLLKERSSVAQDGVNTFFQLGTIFRSAVQCPGPILIFLILCQKRVLRLKQAITDPSGRSRPGESHVLSVKEGGEGGRGDRLRVCNRSVKSRFVRKRLITDYLRNSDGFSTWHVMGHRVHLDLKLLARRKVGQGGQGGQLGQGG